MQQDWSKFHNLSNKSKEAIKPTEEFSKSKSIQKLYEVQDKVAKTDPKFASAIEKEIRFIRHSK